MQLTIMHYNYHAASYHAWLDVLLVPLLLETQTAVSSCEKNRMLQLLAVQHIAAGKAELCLTAKLQVV